MPIMIMKWCWKQMTVLRPVLLMAMAISSILVREE